MGTETTRTAARTTGEQELLAGFARLMRDRYRARLYLFGSRARGNIRKDSDYDILAVADAFGRQGILHRAPDRREMWRAAGGWGIPLDLHCFTEREFRAEARGLGFVGSAKQRGELIRITVSRTRKPPTVWNTDGAEARAEDVEGRRSQS